MTDGYDFPFNALDCRPPFLLRDAIGRDADSLTALAIQVWLHTYATNGISPAIARHVLATYTTEQFLRWVNDPHYVLLVALQRDSLIGFALASFNAAVPTATTIPELLTLYVQPRFVGRGVGSALLHAMQDEATQRRGSSCLELSVHAENGSAIDFYRHHGFVEIGMTNFYLAEVAHKNLVLRGPAHAPQPAFDRIRAVRSGERASIAALINETLHISVDASVTEKTHFLSSMQNNLDWACQHPEQCVHLVYLRAQNIVGVVLVKEYWNLSALMVHPAAHRTGVGGALLELAVARCRARSTHGTIRLNASRNAVEFYLAQGFEIVEGASALLRTTPMQMQL